MSIIWENPGLVLLGVLAGIFLILLYPIIGAIRRSREEREHESLRLREPSIHSDKHDDDNFQVDRPDYGSQFANQSDERLDDEWNSRVARNDDVPAGRFGSGPSEKKKTIRAGATASAKAAWFLLGICVGAGGLALWWNPPTTKTLTALSRILERRDSPAVADRPSPPAEAKSQERFGDAGAAASTSPAAASTPPAAAAGGGASVGKMVEAFVGDLKTQLPMAVGPGITMVSVESNANTVALGFTIAQSVAKEDAPKFQNELETRFRTSVCATPPDPTNIHGLNEMGVSFIIDYVDLLGQKVAGLTVKPKFCSGPT